MSASGSTATGSTKVAIVTGGRTGIGLATLKRFQQQGYKVINISRKPSPLSGCISLEADFTQPHWSQQIGAALEAEIAGAEQLVLVHNAGLHVNDSAMEVDAEAMRRSFDVNVVAPATLNRLVNPHLTPGSAIIYVGSTLSEKAVAGCASYVSAKHALVGLMRATCQDLQGRQVHTACICPGFTDTEMLREHVGNSDEVLKEIASICTYGRLINTDEIAGTLYFCATNPVVNGTVMHANLGQIER
ncbi:SDR family oxidoreductase [Pseudomaricurvus alkylphenolicus]|jgi:NAD(P)-dependent dehydrogenase (short-subunit alcohol dehydrogenase family)|uniref:SDR family NAD(P)-dependent oxidoreductase n=1 Tax=Pseudomaricurvus alkylphenolicus TaxID=1306991 RepID=UPI00142444BB|nr:SDR family oxidoreductase [Pseudomaricurvus alkylphenolicus]NIB39808.1 SDR family oxidoreductase [Pseudomaricurvus alkylphenolicus]